MIKEWMFGKDKLVRELRAELEKKEQKYSKLLGNYNKINQELHENTIQTKNLETQLEKIRQTIATEQNLGIIVLRLMGAITNFSHNKYLQSELADSYRLLMGFSGNPIPWYPFAYYGQK